MTDIPGMPPGMGIDSNTGPVNADGSIDLGNLTAEAVPENVFVPVPVDNYDLFIAEVDVKTTKAGEPMVQIQWMIENHDTYNDRKIRDSFVIPGQHRHTEQTKDGRDKFNVMMDMVRAKLEAITGEEWRSDSMALNPHKDLLGCAVVASVGIETWTNNEGKSGEQNTITRILETRDPSSSGVPGF